MSEHRDPPVHDLTPEDVAAQTQGKAQSFWEHIKETRAKYNDLAPYYPFYDKAKWELAQFLLTSGLSKSKIDGFLKLEWVSIQIKLVISQ